MNLMVTDGLGAGQCGRGCSRGFDERMSRLGGFDIRYPTAHSRRSRSNLDVRESREGIEAKPWLKRIGPGVPREVGPLGVESEPRGERSVHP